MASNPSFECPVCNGYRYYSLSPGRNEGAAVKIYECACCGFSFLDPKRYRPFITPYSTRAGEAALR